MESGGLTPSGRLRGRQLGTGTQSGLFGGRITAGGHPSAGLITTLITTLITRANVIIPVIVWMLARVFISHLHGAFRERVLPLRPL